MAAQELPKSFKALVIVDSLAEGATTLELMSRYREAQSDILCVFGQGLQRPALNPEREDQEAEVDVPQNFLFDRSTEQMWLLIGTFAASRKVIIFTDRAGAFKNHLRVIVDESDGESSSISFRPSAEALTFDLEQALSPWSSFCNKEAVSDFEASQLNAILKKFVKQIVTRASQNNGSLEEFSFDKLMNVTSNLTKTHASIMQKHAKKLNQAPEATMYPFYNNKSNRNQADESTAVLYKPIDVSYNFIRSLFLDKVLENPVLYSAFLENKITNMAQLESYTKVGYTRRFQDLLEKLQSQVSDKQREAERVKQQQLAEEAKTVAQGETQSKGQQQALSTEQKDASKAERANDSASDEQVTLRHVIGSLVHQYLHLFDKAKIYEIKKVKGLQKQIKNYVVGFQKKLQQSTLPGELRKAEVLTQSEEVVMGNIIGILVWAKCFSLPAAKPKQGAALQIEHSSEHVTQLLEKFFASVNGDFAQAVSLIERSGYSMEFKADALQKMVSGDPFAHPQFAKLSSQADQSPIEESKVPLKAGGGSKKGKNTNASTSLTSKSTSSTAASGSQGEQSMPASRQKGKHEQRYVQQYRRN